MYPYVFPNPTSICSILDDRRGTSINIFVLEVGVELIHTEKPMIKKLKPAGEAGELELDENPKKPPLGQTFE